MKTSKVKRFVCGALAAQGIVVVYGNSSGPDVSGLAALIDKALGNESGEVLDEETKKVAGEAEEAFREFSIGCANACVPGDVQGPIDESVEVTE